MKQKRIQAMAALLLFLLTDCASGTGGTSAAPQESAQPWETWDISEDFYRVTQDFSQRYAVLDQDGYKYGQALEAVGDYLDGAVSAETAAETLQSTIDGYKQDLAIIQEFSAGDDLRRQLENCGISAEEYEMFVNSRSTDLYSLQTSLETLLLLLRNAAADPVSAENLAFYCEIDAAEQDVMRGYYYYANFNYWFTGAGEEELTYLRERVVPDFRFYVLEDAVWYDDRDDVEARVMDYLDQLEDLRDQMARRVGQAQTELYGMEQDYQQMADEAEETRQLQEQLEQLQAIQQRLEELSEEAAQASEANDTQRLAQLEEEFYELVAEYEALTGETQR